MSQRCVLTYSQRLEVLDLRHTIINDDAFMEAVRKKYPLSDMSLGDKNLAIWSILVEAAARQNRMGCKKLRAIDFTHNDRVALAHYDRRYLIKQLKMTPAQVDKLIAENPKPVLKKHTPKTKPENVVKLPVPTNNKRLAWFGLALVLGVIVMSLIV